MAGVDYDTYIRERHTRRLYGEDEILPSAGEQAYLRCRCGTVYHVGRTISDYSAVDPSGTKCVKCSPEWWDAVRQAREKLDLEDMEWWLAAFPRPGVTWTETDVADGAGSPG